MRVRSARFRVAVGVHRVIRSLSAVSTAVSDWTVYRKTGPVSRRGLVRPRRERGKTGNGRTGKMAGDRAGAAMPRQGTKHDARRAAGCPAGAAGVNPSMKKDIRDVISCGCCRAGGRWRGPGPPCCGSTAAGFRAGAGVPRRAPWHGGRGPRRCPRGVRPWRPERRRSRT